MEYPTNLSQELTFLQPDTGLGERADASLATLHEHGMVAALGLTPYHAGSIAVLAGQNHIREYCPSDIKTRFGSSIQAERWQRKGRMLVGIYLATDMGGAPVSAEAARDATDEQIRLLAYGWAGPEKNNMIPDAPITTAYRVGKEGIVRAREARHATSGHSPLRLGHALTELVVAGAVTRFGTPAAAISLEAWESNAPARKLYEEVGFDPQASTEDTRPTLVPAGRRIGHNIVYFDHALQERRVADTRVFYRLDASHPLMQQNT